MLARTAVGAARAAARQHARVAARSMATEKEIMMRIQATDNIRKITSSMKMVSAAKLKGDEAKLKAGRPFAQWGESTAGVTVQLTEDADYSDFPQKNLFVPLTSDKGLCGGVNSVMTRVLRAAIPVLDAAGKESDIAIIGEKGRSQMRRLFADSITNVSSDVLRPVSFETAAALAREANAGGYDAVHILFNKHVNQISYDTSIMSIPTLASSETEPLVEYEFEPDTKSELIEDLQEYLLASSIFTGMLEAGAAEQASRMNAMENATKNSGELIDSLTLQYNRARQARITTELVEIISGASAIAD